MENKFVFLYVLERLLVISEHHEKSFESIINQKYLINCEQIQNWSHQILHALIYLQEKQLNSRNLSLSNIRLTDSVRFSSSNNGFS